MLWLYLLGAVTVLAIALRRVVHRQAPLTDELCSTKVAFEHLQSGVAWVQPDQTLGAVNASLAATLSADARDLIGRSWVDLFAELEHDRAREAYATMLLQGKTEFDAYGQRSDGTYAWLNVRLVPVHDHKMRFVGHHCLILDSTRTRILEDRVKELESEQFSVAR